MGSAAGRAGLTKALQPIVDHRATGSDGNGTVFGMGGASAAAIVLFLILVVLTLIQQYIQRKWRY